MAGATSLYPVAKALIAAYAERYPQVRIHLETEMLRDGVQAVRSGQADIGLVARDLPMGDGLEGLSATPIGLDGIVIAVNARNPIKALSLEQLRQLYTGAVFNWAKVGGKDVEVQVVSREAGSDTRQVFEAKVMLGRRVTLQAVVVPNSEAVSQYIKVNESAIGYLTASYLQPGLKGLMLEGVPPDKAAVRSGAYPLVRPLFLVTRADAPEPVRAFVAFALSQAGQAIVARYHAKLP